MSVSKPDLVPLFVRVPRPLLEALRDHSTVTATPMAVLIRQLLAVTLDSADRPAKPQVSAA